MDDLLKRLLDDCGYVEDSALSFAEELQELAQDLAVAEAFGMDAMQGMTWLAPVQTFDDLPVQPVPGTCVYVDNEEAAYMWDGCGWVMFMAPTTVKPLAEQTAQTTDQSALNRITMEWAKPKGRVLSSRRR